MSLYDYGLLSAFLLIICPVAVYFSVKLARYAYLAGELQFLRHHVPSESIEQRSSEEDGETHERS